MVVPSLTPEELEALEILADPCKWAAIELDWHARWYQEEMMKATSNRVVIRAGRRVGKTDSMVVKMLHKCYTNNDFRILVVTPFESQIKHIFDRFRQLIRKSKNLQASVIRDIRSPNTIEFGNGSRIIGFTAGTTSGGGAANVRGQGADFIYLDEADYLSDDDIDTIISVAYEDAERIEIWATSTPTGRRGRFWEWCTRKELGWQEFHYTSHVNPNWTEAAERDARNNLTELGYIHEILAEFGDMAEGVFRRKYVEKAAGLGKELGIEVVDTVDYNAIRCVGIDWDKKNAPTQIVVTEYDPKHDLFYPIHRTEIPSGEFTYSNAIREIVRINAEFNPAFIYADRGHGEYQIEALHKYGEMHPETGLDKKVRGISFSDRIRIPDPVTKEIDNKDIKPFMVNQAVLLLENGRLALPTNDRLIMDQMLDYYEERRTPTGRPVYSSENDHALDAFMLSLLAFTLEFTDIAKSKLTSQIAPAPKLDFAYDYTHQKKKQKKAFTGAAFVDSGTMRGFGTRSSLRKPPRRTTF
jgi:replicative DNA helicase